MNCKDSFTIWCGPGWGAIHPKEQTVQNINPALLFSGTVPACMEKMTDTLLNGLGSAVDALMAVRELVYERKLVTMQELRLQALRLLPKYGTGHEMADHYAAAIVQQYHAWVASERNPHGGRITTEVHSARTFIDEGLRTMASPTVGMDTKGVAAFYAVLQTYMEKGGASIHFNIADTATLRDAQEHPEKYGDL